MHLMRLGASATTRTALVGCEPRLCSVPMVLLVRGACPFPIVCSGITINQYQVDRATHHNDKLGVSPLADVVRGNFCEMPFPENTFDAAYAIEATCHGEACRRAQHNKAHFRNSS